MDGRPFRCQRGDRYRVRTEEEIADCQAPALSDRALCQTVRPIVHHVAALKERAQIRWPIVGRIAVQVRRCEYGARHPKPSRLHKVGPAGRASLGDPAMSPLACRTSVRPVGSGGGRGVVGHNVGTFLQCARSGRGCSARASAGDRAVATRGGWARLRRRLLPKYALDAAPANAEPSCNIGRPELLLYRSLWTTAESTFGFRPL